MKTLIAAITLSLATAGAAFANDTATSDRGIPATEQSGWTLNSMQVSGYTGMNAVDQIVYQEANEHGYITSVDREYAANAQVSGFVGMSDNAGQEQFKAKEYGVATTTLR